jgi:hypothetical protein
MERKNRAKEDILTLYIFDMDGTLLNSPLPDDGKAEYERITGKKYPHRGWWSKEESLLAEFNIQCHLEVIEDYKKAMEDQTGLVVMLTNRMQNLKKPIFSIFDKHRLVFDICSFKYDGRSKLDRAISVMDQYPNINKFEAWEDMRQHITDLVRVFELKPAVASTIHFVGDDRVSKDRSNWAHLSSSQEYQNWLAL